MSLKKLLTNTENKTMSNSTNYPCYTQTNSSMFKCIDGKRCVQISLMHTELSISFHTAYPLSWAKEKPLDKDEFEELFQDIIRKCQSNSK